MEESWRPVVGFEGYYEISNQGRVKSLDRRGTHVCRWGMAHMKFSERMMSICTSKNGYKYVKLRLPSKNAKHSLIHRLVLAAHVGPPANGQKQANHIDGDKGNNHVSNLEWCTPLQNVRHCIDVLGKKRGEGAASKVTEADVRAIRDDGRTLKQIAADYGVTLQAIWMIRKRKNWAHVA